MKFQEGGWTFILLGWVGGACEHKSSLFDVVELMENIFQCQMQRNLYDLFTLILVLIYPITNINKVYLRKIHLISMYSSLIKHLISMYNSLI